MPWPDEPCAACPRLARGLSLPCRAQTSRHRRFCDLADPDHPDHQPAYRRMLADEPEPDPAPPLVPPPMPGIVRQVMNFAVAATTHVATGAKIASEKERQDRLEICGACDRHQAGRCAACGCLVVVKTSWAEQRCPLDPPKWGPVGATPTGQGAFV